MFLWIVKYSFDKPAEVPSTNVRTPFGQDQKEPQN